MRHIGFSTGALARGDFRAALQMLKGKNVSAIELSALRISELPALLEAFESLDLSNYKYVAIHAPTDASDDAQLVDQLKELVSRHEQIRIVVHPDSMNDIEMWAQLNGNVSLENMDSRKPIGQTVDEFRELFEQLPDAKFCLDIGHARQVDPTMIEAVLFLREYRDRLSHLHMSEVDSEGKHHPMSRGTIEAFRELAVYIDDDIPVIIESCVNEDEVERELELARDVLSSSASPSVL